MERTTPFLRAMKNRSVAPIVRAGLRLLAVAVAVGSCVTRGYKLADKSVPPAVPLELASAPVTSTDSSPILTGAAAPAATVHTVIITTASR